MMDDETKHILISAASEIRQLRQANAILGAKVEMIDLFACVLHSKAAQRTEGAAIDVAWQIDRLLATTPPQPAGINAPIEAAAQRAAE